MSADKASNSADSKGSHSELTSTVHLSSLKPVPGELDSQALLASLSPELAQIVNQLEPDVAMFIVLAGPGLGGRYLLDGEVTTVGRESSNEILLDDITVSRKHAVIKKTNGSYAIEDLRSLNGTYVNAKAVATSSLRTGDEVHVGKYRLTFFQGGK